MGVAVEVGLVLILVGVALSYVFRGRRMAQQQAMTERRVDAYIETIRRERTHPDLVAMSDTELRDLLLSSAHNLKVQRDRRLYLLFGGVIVALIGAILVATEDGSRGFGIAMVDDGDIQHLPVVGQQQISCQRLHTRQRAGFQPRISFGRLIYKPLRQRAIGRSERQR